MSIHSILDKAQRRIAKSTRLVRLALLLRNQCDCVIAYRLGESNWGHRNGEDALVERVAPLCTRFMDIGANTGEWTAHFLQRAKRGAQGLLFEPSLSSLEALQGRYAGDGRVCIVDQAVGNAPGRLTFAEEPGAGQTSSLVPAMSNDAAQMRHVAVTTVDEQMALRGWDSVDFLKIDTEGYDCQVLRGAADTLAGQRARIVQFEYNTGWAQAGDTLYAALDFCRDRGYRVFLLRSTGLHEIDYERYGEFFRYSNFVAVSPAFLSHVQDMIRPAV